MCLGNISGDFSTNNMKLNGCVHDFAVDYKALKKLNEKTWSKIIFGIIKKMFIALLTSLINDSSYTRCVFLSNQKWEIQPTLIN